MDWFHTVAIAPELLPGTYGEDFAYEDANEEG